MTSRISTGRSPVNPTPDVIIIGAGVSGLAAANHLLDAGLDVVILEARRRIGGRIHTQHGSSKESPVELGAEFVHGKPPQLFDLINEAHLTAVEIADRRLLAENGDLRSLDEFWKLIEKVDAQIPNETTLTYEQFLSTVEASPFTKEIARSYVEGFNAARAELISASGIRKEDRASEEIEGSKQFRIVEGYDRVVQMLAEGITPDRIHLDTTVQELHWKSGVVEVRAMTPAGPRVFTAAKALITLPIGVLKTMPGQPGAVRFRPELPQKEEVLKHLHMGHVVKLVLKFRTRFWEMPEIVGKCGDFGFVLCLDAEFPTWWTQKPLNAKTLTAWAGGSAAEKLSSLTPDALRERAVRTLAQIFSLEVPKVVAELESCSMHDWTNDPLSRGAYSYPGIGGLAAARVLAEPIEQTLFFAGEATDWRGFNGTVHGAIESGYRAAGQIIAG